MRYKQATLDVFEEKFLGDKDKVLIFDTTMRDGEQSPGASMRVEEKIQISRVFD